MPWKRAPNCATGPTGSAGRAKSRVRVSQYNTIVPAVDTLLPSTPKMKWMPLGRVPALLLIFCLIASGTSCLARRRAITRRGAGATKNPALLVANRDTLVNEIAKQFDAIHDFNATVDMIPALGSAEKNKVTEYKDVRAYIVFRKPSDIRLIGLYP